MRYYIFGIIINIIFLLPSCLNNKKEIPEGRSKLTVTVDSNAIFFLSTITAEVDGSKYQLERQYDDTLKSFKYVYGKIQNNEYSINLSSLLNRTYTFPLTLTKDTTIFIDKSQLQNFEILGKENYALTDFQTNDTIYFGYEQQGCWGHYFDLIRIVKNPNDFTVEVKTDTSQNKAGNKLVVLKNNLSLNFSDSIKKLELACLELFKKQQENLIKYGKEIKQAKTGMDSARLDYFRYNMSTLTKNLYVIKGNKVFCFYLWGDEKNEYCYQTFLKSLNLFHQ
jgi:hypothetical protein